MVLTCEATEFQLPSATQGTFGTVENFQQNNKLLEETMNFPLLKTQSSSLSDILKDSFKKSDSFTRWMSKELAEVDDSQVKSSSGLYWNSEDADSIIGSSSRDQLDQFTLDPMLAQDQLFSIIDFSPSWTYAGSKTRVCQLNFSFMLLKPESLTSVILHRTVQVSQSELVFCLQKILYHAGSYYR
jgi:hypothetical protein